MSSSSKRSYRALTSPLCGLAPWNAFSNAGERLCGLVKRKCWEATTKRCATANSPSSLSAWPWRMQQADSRSICCGGLASMCTRRWHLQSGGGQLNAMRLFPSSTSVPHVCYHDASETPLFSCMALIEGKRTRSRLPSVRDLIEAIAAEALIKPGKRESLNNSLMSGVDPSGIAIFSVAVLLEEPCADKEQPQMACVRQVLYSRVNNNDGSHMLNFHAWLCIKNWD